MRFLWIKFKIKLSDILFNKKYIDSPKTVNRKWKLTALVKISKNSNNDAKLKEICNILAIVLIVKFLINDFFRIML